MTFKPILFGAMFLFAASPSLAGECSYPNLAKQRNKEAIDNSKVIITDLWPKDRAAKIFVSGKHELLEDFYKPAVESVSEKIDRQVTFVDLAMDPDIFVSFVNAKEGIADENFIEMVTKYNADEKVQKRVLEGALSTSKNLFLHTYFSHDFGDISEPREGEVKFQKSIIILKITEKDLSVEDLANMVLITFASPTTLDRTQACENYKGMWSSLPIDDREFDDDIDFLKQIYGAGK